MGWGPSEFPLPHLTLSEQIVANRELTSSTTSNSGVEAQPAAGSFYPAWSRNVDMMPRVSRAAKTRILASMKDREGPA